MQSKPDTDHEGSPQNTAMWKPIWLRWASLLAISAGFALLGIILIILWHYSTVNNGFALLSTNHYSWTYGPTAVLVLIVAVWRQVDFHCKSLAPWHELQHGNTEASDSLLLDYVSPFLPVALFRACSKQNWTISATILGFIILKLITVTSTGLLTMEATKITLQESALLGTTQLDGMLVNTTLYATPPTLFDSSIVYKAYGIMSKGLPYAEGAKPNLVYESFELPNPEQYTNSTISATVDAFVPRFSCEEVEVTTILPPQNSTDSNEQAMFYITSPSCNLESGSDSVLPSMWIRNPRVNVAP